MWKYNGKILKEIPTDAFGFVYKITNLETKEYYIGSKQFYSNTNAKISKKRSNELYSGKGRKPTREKKQKESNWKTYISSSKKVQEMIAISKDLFIFEIQTICFSKAEMLILEAMRIGNKFLDKDPLILNEWITLKTPKIK
jgi:nicotinic acid phosphoribosyltransferase